MSESARASGVRGTWAGARRKRELTTGVSPNRTYTYDEVGNRLTKSDAGALCTYGYDRADQLLRVGPWGSYPYPTVWSSDANGNLTVENVADSRKSKVQSRKGTRSGHRFGACPERRRRRPDLQGHVRQVTDVDGDVVAEHQYDAWGLIKLTAASAVAFGDWGYTWDGKPGRYYVQQRRLRTDLGRWMSRDPVESEPPYPYVANRPTLGVDPSGEQFPVAYGPGPVDIGTSPILHPDHGLRLRSWRPLPRGPEGELSSPEARRAIGAHRQLILTTARAARSYWRALFGWRHTEAACPPRGSRR